MEQLCSTYSILLECILKGHTATRILFLQKRLVWGTWENQLSPQFSGVSSITLLRQVQEAPSPLSTQWRGKSVTSISRAYKKWCGLEVVLPSSPTSLTSCDLSHWSCGSLPFQRLDNFACTLREGWGNGFLQVIIETIPHLVETSGHGTLPSQMMLQRLLIFSAWQQTRDLLCNICSMTGANIIFIRCIANFASFHKRLARKTRKRLGLVESVSVRAALLHHLSELPSYALLLWTQDMQGSLSRDDIKEDWSSSSRPISS